jgi:hypothetical protein
MHVDEPGRDNEACAFDYFRAVGSRDRSPGRGDETIVEKDVSHFVDAPRRIE